MITITGNTYPHRQRLKSLGGRWNASQKRWEMPDETAEEAQALVNRKHPADDYVSFEIRTSTGHTFYRNKRGMCEDAPCCGCCTF